jgi:hypothetical protein
MWILLHLEGPLDCCYRRFVSGVDVGDVLSERKTIKYRRRQRSEHSGPMSKKDTGKGFYRRGRVE